MNRNTWKYKILTAAAAAVFAAAALASCSGVRASLTVPGSGSSVTYEKFLSFPAVSSPSTGAETQNVQYYFPRAGQPAQPELIRVIRSARKTLDIAIYSFTDPQICSAIVGARERGVAVRLITDREQSSGKSQKAVLKQIGQAGIPIKIDSHSGIMHLKVTIADRQTATTGSFNYTKSAEKSNDEVLVVLKDEKIAGDFETEFNRMWNDTGDFTDYKNR